MATKKINEEKIEVTKSVAETKVVDTEKEDLKNQVDKLSKLVEQLLKEKETIKSENKVEETPTITEYKKIDPMSVVTLVQMVHGGGDYSTGKFACKFTDLFDSRPLRYEYVEDLRYRFPQKFETLELFIPQKEYREALGLTQFYDKYEIEENTFKKMLSMNGNDIVTKLSTFPDGLKQSFVYYFIQEAKNENPECLSPSKRKRLNEFLNIKLEDFIYVEE